MPKTQHVVCPHCDAVNRIPVDRLTQQPKCGKCKDPLFTGSPVELSDHNFATHLRRNDLPVVVDFWAPWCGPCRMQAPILEKVAAAVEGKARVGKLNVDESPAIAARFAVSGIPTLIIFKDGEEVDRMVGLQAEEVLVDKLTAQG